MEYKFSGQISYGDFMQFQQFNLKHMVKSLFPRNRFFALLLIVIAYVLYNFRTGHFFQTAAILLFMAIVAGAAFLVMYHAKGLYLKSFFKDISNARECRYTVNENCINIQFEDSLMHLGKESIHRVLCDGDSIYVYQAPKAAKIIKKRFFASDHEYQKVLSFIEKEYAGQTD